MSAYQELLTKIENKSAVIGILGIGYVGRSLGEYISQAGYKTIGFDLAEKRVKDLNNKKINKFSATTDFAKLKECDVITISVPTPADENKKPDLVPLIKVSETIMQNMRKGQLIILESTVAPGTSKEIMLPILEKSNLKVEEDFFIGYSPERIDFGNPEYTIKNIPKVVAGYSEKSKELTFKFYSNVIDKAVAVSTLEAGEMVKIWENTFRFVNINLINELTEYAIKRGINIWEVIDAAKTKPFGFFPFYPSAGIAGHCIPVDPYYLLDDADKHGSDLSILRTSMTFHDKRLKMIIDKIFDLLKEKTNPKLLILGITVKEGSDDIRESVGLKVWQQAEKKGIQVSYYDKNRPKFDGKQTVEFTKDIIDSQDLIVIITKHPSVDYKILLDSNKPIIDLQNAIKEKANNIYRL